MSLSKLEPKSEFTSEENNENLNLEITNLFRKMIRIEISQKRML